MALWAGLLAGSLLVGLGSGVLAAQVDQSGRDAGLIVVLNLLYWLGWGVLAIGVVSLGRRFPLNGRPLAPPLAIHVAASIGAALLHMFAFAFLSSVVRSWWTGVELSPASPWSRRQFEWELTMYWACTGLAHVAASREQHRADQLLTAKLEAELAQARLVALQRQIQPHFLFNTLHTLMAVMHRDVTTASRLIEALADVVRASLKGNSKGMTSLAEELELVRAYLMIEQTNRGVMLQTSIDVEEGIAGALVPQLVLQPLVENAIRHGCSTRSEGARVQVAAQRRNEQLEISVTDNGNGQPSSTPGFGIALANIRSRLELIYGERHQFELSPAPGGGVRAHLTVPLRFAA